MSLDISKDLEKSIQSKAKAAGFESTEDYLLSVLELEESSQSISTDSREQWSEKFDAFVKKQTSRNPTLDDSRESLYPVRR